MATVRVKFRKSSVSGKAGVIYYQLCHLQKTQQITTKFHVYPHQWNADTGQLLIPESDEQNNLRQYQRQIDDDIQILRKIIGDLNARQAEYSLPDVIDLFFSPGKRTTVFTFMEEQIISLKEKKQLGTAKNYRRTLKSFSKFLLQTDISFTLLTEDLVMEYNDWLQEHKVKRNTTSFYMRVLRSVYNKAVRQHLVVQTFPFQNVYTGVDKTRKRAVDEEIIIQLQKLDLSSSPALALTRDIFIFSYCTRGMAFVDIAFLSREDIVNDAICYTRRKTGQTLEIHIEPCINTIIQRYINENKASPYIFPLITTTDPEIAYTQYQTALGYHNIKLKRLSKLIGLEIPLTSYTPRHTWATIARNHDVPVSIISAGMGHTSEKTTQIYLASLENSIIDRANQGILAALNS